MEESEKSSQGVVPITSTNALGIAHRVIARNGVQMRGGPGTEFSVIESLATNQIVYVIKRSGDWSQLDLQNDGLADGYCLTEYLQAVTA